MVRTSTKVAGWGQFPGTKEGLVVIGLGGNWGDVRAAFHKAVEGLARYSSFGRVSSLFRSFPVGPSQPDFLNAAVLIDWPEPLDCLLSVTQSLELEAGRTRELRWGPRTLDLDILWAFGRTVFTSSLSVPHPLLQQRRFALEPLLELVPDAHDPVSGVRLEQTLATLENQDVTLLAKRPW